MLSNVFANNNWTIFGAATESAITAISALIIAVILCLTSVILYRHKRKWRILDPLIFLLIIQSTINQLITCVYSSLVILQPTRPAYDTWCPVISWILASSHTLQNATLTTLSLSALLRARLHPTKYKKTFSKSHLIYHGFCLFLLSSCVGVAAILADTSANSCFPYQDKRYLIFYLILHWSLIGCSFISLLYSCCCCHPETAVNNSSSSVSTKNLLLNSTSDLSSGLSDLSMISSMKSSRNYYNNDKIFYSASNCSSRYKNSVMETLLENQPPESNETNSFINSCGTNSNIRQPPPQIWATRPIMPDVHLQYDTDNSTYNTKRYSTNGRFVGTDGFGYMSSATSTNSRSPSGTEYSEPTTDVCLTTISAIVCMSYFVNHIPVLLSILLVSIAPEYLPLNWPQKTFPLWATLAEGCLFPIILFVFDEQFVPRISGFCQTSLSQDKGVYGKFRPYSGTLSTANIQKTDSIVRFPLTNGSLFTTRTDQRLGLPIVHNRFKGERERNILPSTLFKHDVINQRQLCFAAAREQRRLRNLNDNNRMLHSQCSRLNHRIMTNTGKIAVTNEISQINQNYKKRDDGNDHLNYYDNSINASKERYHVAAECNRLSSLNHSRSTTDTEKYLENFQQKLNSNSLFLSSSKNFYDSEDDEDYAFDDSENDEPIYATLSTHGSTCSATIAANDDFEFFRNRHSHNRRSNIISSQATICRSLESTTTNEQKREHLKRAHSFIRKHRSDIHQRSSFISHQVYVKRPKHDFVENGFSKRRQNAYHANYDCNWYDHPLQYHPEFRRSIEPIQRRRGPAPDNPLKTQLTSMLSVDSLINVLTDRNFSYLDTGDICHHPSQIASSVPDLKKVFITEFL